ncbi:hypothetical protein SynSYN20_01567 [Synechococcus sp. SYN20]|uniref:hypothetical protein n=1 Tax=Synechococcus sp. SYN20 TaxID=1050714 RepID=UPI0016491B5F|nr:hypothetical protein [Synechococcus sp. SYN20]QNJ25894.1 hypothetical protein SynSYN20_01567 [Synechococcus sp. SYN20]
MIDECTLQHLGGCLGAVAFDDQPRVTPGRVRPFIWAYLLLRGAVRRHEVVGALSGHVRDEDIRVEDDPLDRSTLEVTVDDCLANLVLANVLRFNGDLYVLKPEALARTVSLVTQLDAQLPDHLLHDLAGR